MEKNASKQQPRETQKDIKKSLFFKIISVFVKHYKLIFDFFFLVIYISKSHRSQNHFVFI